MKIPKIKIRGHPKKKHVEKEAEWPFESLTHTFPSPFERETWRRISSINHALRIERFLAYLEGITGILTSIGYIINKIPPYLPLFLYLLVYFLLIVYFDHKGSL